MRRAFVTLSDGRHVHYRCAGSGPPLVLLHASPDSSAALEHFWRADRTLLLLDVPGFGESDALDVAAPALEDYADALHETLDALGIDSIQLAGWGSGANIAVAFAARHPGRVAALETFDLVAYVGEERDWLLANLAPSLEPVWDGSHLVRAWMIRRDMHLFRPWFARTPERRLDTGLPPAEQLHREAVDLLRAGAHWPDADLAAIRATPPAAPGARASAAFDLTWAGFGQGKTGSAETALTPIVGTMQDGFTREYADVSFGQVHLRRIGPRGGLPLLILHSSPGSSRGILRLAAHLASALGREVVAIDTPGFGDSDPLPNADPYIADFADAVLEVFDALRLPVVDLFGTHTGASIALAIATRAPGRVRKVVFDGLPMFTPMERAEHLASYIPPFEIHWDGSHLVWVWNFLRNMSLFYPWYAMDAQHSTGRVPDTALLHQRAVDLIKAGVHYADGYRAVYRDDARAALRTLSAPALLCVSREDVLAHHAAAVHEARPEVQITWLPAAERLPATADAIVRFLALDA